MTVRHHPPHLRLVGTEADELANRAAPARADAPTIDDIAAASLVDAGRYMIEAAVDAAVDGAADFGLTCNTETLRREIGRAVTRYVDGWIIEKLTENDDVVGH
jgi:hypothetical protein